jgi:UDP-N-acetylglucosamine transferase subunit ALG13
MPRRAHLRETRSDHQVATSERFATRPNVVVAHDETALPACLELALNDQASDELAPGSSHAHQPLIQTLRNFIETGK